jgi:hypothetical protein
MSRTLPSSLFAVLAMGSFDPTALKCSLLDGKFVSEIFFKYDHSNHLVGELDHYLRKNNHERYFISGNIFFDIAYKNGLIYGSTGDPRGVINSFRLSRKGVNNTGRWVYQVTELSGEKTEVTFPCSYNPKK